MPAPKKGIALLKKSERSISSVDESQQQICQQFEIWIQCKCLRPSFCIPSTHWEVPRALFLVTFAPPTAAKPQLNYLLSHELPRLPIAPQ